jgi:hypothetical protein
LPALLHDPSRFRSAWRRRSSNASSAVHLRFARILAMDNPPPADLVIGWAWKGSSYCRKHKPRPESNRVPAPVPIFTSEARRDYQVCIKCGVPLVPIEDGNKK